MIFHRAGKYDYLHAVRQIWRGRALFRRRKDNMQAERHHGDQSSDNLLDQFQPAIGPGAPRARHVCGPQMQIVPRDHIEQRVLYQPKPHGDEGEILAHVTKCGSRTSQTDKARNCVLGSARLCDA